MTEVANVSTPSSTFLRLEQRRTICRDLMQGLPRIQEQAAIYAPREPMEVPVAVPVTPYSTQGWIDPWKLRVGRLRLEPIFQDAVDSLVGRPFSKPPKMEEGTPEPLVEFSDDVDAQGNNLQVFSLGQCSTAIAEGISFVLVDFSDVEEAARRTVDDDRRAGLRPFWRPYSPGAVFYWESETRSGITRLKTVRMRERVSEPDGPWGMNEIDQIRVMFAGDPGMGTFTRWEVWRQNEKDEWFLFDQGIRRPQVDIPLVAFTTDETGFFEACPPLLDLAHLNIAHLRKASILDNAQNHVGFPVFHWSGVNKEQAVEQLSGGWGSNRFIISPDAAGSAGFVEPQGTSWDKVSAAMDSIMARCEKLAGDPTLASSPGNLTATGEAIRSSKTSSKLGSWVQRWEDSLSTLFFYTAIDLGLIKPNAEEGWGGVELNKQFVPTAQNTEGVRLLSERNQAGKLSDETTHEALVRAELLPESLTYEEEQQRLAQQGPALGEIGRGPEFARKVAALMAQGLDLEAAIAQVEGGDEPPEPPPFGAKQPVPEEKAAA